MEITSLHVFCVLLMVSSTRFKIRRVIVKAKCGYATASPTPSLCSLSRSYSLFCTRFCTIPVLYGTIRYGTKLHCTVLYCTALHCTALYCTALHCTALYCTALYYISTEIYSLKSYVVNFR